MYKKLSVEQIIELVSPISGESFLLSEGKDPVFAEGIMGLGCFIVPDSEGKLYSPCNGVVNTVFPTMHAYGLTTDNGIEVILHIGVDTVELNGELFTCQVVNNQRIKKGDLIAEFDWREMINRMIVPDVFIVLQNLNHYDLEVRYGKVDVGDTLFSLLASKR